MSESSPANSANLAESVAAALRQRLIVAEIKAGQHLSEAQLCQQLNVSRNTLREAFRILMKEGLLRHAPNRGVSVVEPSMADIIDIYRVRRCVECQALAQAWPLHPAHAAMQSAVDAAVAARAAQDWLAVGSANMQFHAAIVALADSVRLSVMFQDIAAELRLAFGMLDNLQYLHAPFVEQNQQLLALFEQNQMQQAAQMLENYLVQSERMLLAAYARRHDPSSAASIVGA